MRVTPRTEKPRVFITGGSGFLATNWACAVRDTWDVVLATHRHQVELEGVTSRPVPLDDASVLEQVLEELRPDLIVHTAGLTDVDRCEADPAAARHSNAEIAREVAAAAAARDVRLVHISTDHLFAGDQPLVAEDEPPAPINEYARSKLLAEDWVAAAHPEALVVRTNFYGWGHAGRQSFSDWIIYRLRAGEAISAFDDVYYTPVLADDVVHWVHELAAKRATGVFNVCGDERVSKYDFAMRLAGVFDLDTRLIRRSSIAQASLRAPRPSDMSLDNGKARVAIGRPPRAIVDQLRELRAQENAGRRELLSRAVRPCT